MSLSPGSPLLRAAVLALTISLTIISINTLALAADNSGNAAEAIRLAQPETPETLDNFIELGLRTNPAVKARRFAWKQSLQKRLPAASLPDPVLSYTQPIHEIETRLGPNKRSAMLSQDFPFPGTLKTRGRVAGTEAQLARLALDKTIRQLVLDIKKAYFELYYLDRASMLAEEKTRLFKHLTKARRNDYSVDSIGFSDVIEAETRFADAKYELILLSELRKAAASNLNTLLNRDPESKIGALAETPIKAPDTRLPELYKNIKNNEEMLESNLLIKNSELKEKLARLKTRPRFKLALNYTEIGMPDTGNIKDGGKDAVAATMAITLPIWTKKNNGGREAARLARLAAVETKAAVANTLNTKTKTAYIEMKTNYQLLTLYSKSLIPKAEKLIKTAEAAYKNGKGGLSDLFEPRIMRIEFKMAYYHAATNYQKNRAELERLTAGFALKESTDE